MVMDVTSLAEKQAQDRLRDQKPLNPNVAKRLQEEASGLRASRYHN